MTPPSKIFPTLAALALLAGLGCFGTTQPVVFHTLQAVAPRGTRPRPGLAVEILPVLLPEVLLRPQFVASLGAGSVELLPGHRWADPLDQDIQRVVVEDLARILGSDRIVAAPYGPRVGAAFRVEVRVLRCDGRPGGTLALRTTWMITRPGVERALVLGRTDRDVPVAGPGGEALAAAHALALAGLCEELAQALPAPTMP